METASAQQLFEQSHLLAAQGRAVEAISSLHRAIEIEPTLVAPEIHINMASHLASQGDAAGAVACYKRALALSPDLVVPYEQLIPYYLGLGNVAEALDCLQQILRIDPERGEISSKRHVNQTVTFRIGWIKKQLRELKLSLIEGPGEIAEAFNDVARGRIDLARERYQTVFDSERQEAPVSQFTALFNCGAALRTLAIISGKPDYTVDATELLRRAAGFPLSAVGSVRLAQAFAELGRALEMLVSNEPSEMLSHVLECFDRAIELDPEATDPYRERGEVLQRTGRMLDSFHDLGRYMALRSSKTAAHPLAPLNIRFLNESNTYALGHLAFLLDCYKKMELLGWTPKFQTVILAPPWMIANQCLLDYWRKYFTIITDPELIEKLNPIARELEVDTSYVMLPDGRATNTRMALSYVQAEWEKQKRAPLLSLSKEDADRGREALESLGLPKGAWFVTLHVREAAFKQESGCAHNFHRNAEIESFELAIEEIVKRGGWVVRVGEPNTKPLKARPGVIDYAHSSKKSDWMDVFLCAECRFLLGTCSGVFLVSQLFGVPVVTTNFPPTNMLYGQNDLFLPKQARSKADGRMLSLREFLSPPIVDCEYGKLLQELGIEFLDNTAEEIRDITVEMLDRREQKINYSAEDQRLQQQFRSYLDPAFGMFTSRIGQEFLRRYQQHSLV